MVFETDAQSNGLSSLCGGLFIVRPCPYKSKEISFSFRVFLRYVTSNSDKQLAKPVSFLFRACSKGRLSVWGGNPGAKGQRRKIKQSQSCFRVAMVAFGCVMIFDVLLFWAFTCLSSFFSPLQSTQFSLSVRFDRSKLPT